MSQYGEHEFILQHFAGRKGEFLDVGAYDGLIFSNTRCLMELGWPGLCVEPNPLVFPYLMENTKQFPEVDLLQALISPRESSGIQPFWAVQDMLSTSDHAHKAKVESHNPALLFRKVWAVGITWAELLNERGRCDFINVDVEGMNLELLRDMPIEQFRPSLICIELDPKQSEPEMREILGRGGLRNAKVIGGNLLAWA